ncbi:MAG: SpoIIE family protein phosphatase [Salinivirgaceae bacterium]|nr:SpoIIE family protein phosphatase [Salinivirgaceae bacterium]
MGNNYSSCSVLCCIAAICAAIFSLLSPIPAFAQTQLDSTILKQISPDLQTAKVYAQIDDFEAATVYLNKAEQTVASIGDTADLLLFYHTIVNNYNLFSFEIAQNYTNKMLEIGTQKRDTATLVSCYLTLGSFLQWQNYDQSAEENYKIAARLCRQSNNHYSLVEVLCTMGYFYGGQAEKHHSDSINLIVIQCFKESARICDSLKITEGQWFDYTYIGLAGCNLGVAEGTGDQRYTDTCYYYFQKVAQSPTLDKNHKNDVYVRYLIQRRQYQKALDYVDANFDKNGTDYHKKLHTIYGLMGNYREAYRHLQAYHELTNQTNVEENARVLAKSEADRAAAVERVKRDADKRVYEADERRMQTIIVSLICGLALILLWAVFIVRMLHAKHKANAELARKNTELAEQKEEITSQRDEIATQRDTIRAQRDEIQASINYARRIQRSLLTPAETIDRIFPDHFLLYKPRNVVSGDYYWVGQFGDNKVCIVADCTGHGVPGGFMSVLGMTNLNWIVGQDVSPDMILNRLREAIIANLRQSDDAPTALQDDGEKYSAIERSTDGMDVAVYVINERQMTLTFAGANNPLVLIRGNEIKLLKANKMPVGIYARMAPFVNITVDLQKGDCIYTYSDGYQDQFGEGTDKKFMGSRLRELLLEIHERPMAEQKKILNSTYEEWRGPASNQTDDVVVMGVRV